MDYDKQNKNAIIFEIMQILLCVSSEIEEILIKLHSDLKTIIMSINNIQEKTEINSQLSVLEDFKFFLMEIENLMIKIKSQSFPENLNGVYAEAFCRNILSVVEKIKEIIYKIKEKYNNIKILEIEDKFDAMNELVSSLQGLKL